MHSILDTIRSYLDQMAPHVYGQKTEMLLCEAADEIERLWAIVEKLPKTADGVPVVPGMKVYRPKPQKACGCSRPPHEILVEAVEVWTGHEKTQLVRSSGKTRECFPVSEIYSTREAAEAGGDDE